MDQTSFTVQIYESKPGDLSLNDWLIPAERDMTIPIISAVGHLEEAIALAKSKGNIVPLRATIRGPNGNQLADLELTARGIEQVYSDGRESQLVRAI